MSLKGKIPPELKIQAVEDYQATRKGSTEIIKELGIRRSTFQSWVRKYQMEGRSGKLMISIQGKDKEIEIQNVRSLEKETVSWKTLVNEIEQLYERTYQLHPADVWEEVYQEPFPGRDKAKVSETEPEEKAEIAPAQVQQEARTEKPEQTVEKACCDAATENPGDRVITVSETDSVNTDNAEEQISGQDSVEQHPEWLPEGYVKPEEKPSQKKVSKEMLSCARNSLSNIQTEMKAGAYKAALASAKHLVHYLTKAVEEEG